MLNYDDKNTTSLRSAETHQAPYEMQRSERFASFVKELPVSYTRNTPKEELCLQFVDVFRTQFTSLYPKRPPLLLSPLNESGETRKFISTYVRPTQIRFPEMYDWSTTAKFIANYIQYEPLTEDVDTSLGKVTSPSSTLLWQIGNCIEMSILLCSLLLGNGYNAYCVMGYAVKEVRENDQGKNAWADKLADEHNSDDEGEKAAERQTFFTQHLKKRPPLKSVFDADEEARLRKKLNEIDGGLRDDAGGNDDEDARSLHCWVLILPSHREVKNAFFVEPSTGLSVSIDDKHYLTIDSIFNHQNYWVNLNPGKTLPESSWELRDLTKWEHIFLTDPGMLSEDDTSALDRFRQEEQTSDIGDSGDQILDLSYSWVNPLVLSRAQYENRFPGREKMISYADAKVHYFADFSDPESRVLEIHLPDDVSIHDQVHIFFKHRKDKLRRRSIWYANDLTQSTARLIREWFQPGRTRGNESKVEGLREMIIEPGIQRTMRFYWRAREDGLWKRIERLFSEAHQEPKKIKEFYQGREDQLVYRSASYDPPKETSGTAVSMGNFKQKGDENQRVVLRMSEKLQRFTKVKAEEDVAKRTYIKPGNNAGEIWVLYQYGKDNITRPYRLFPKDIDRDDTSAGGGSGPQGGNVSELTPVVVTMPFAEPPKDTELQDELRILLLKEKNCISEVNNKIEEMKELIEARKDDEQNLLTTFSPYDTLRNRVQETEEDIAARNAEEQRKAESRKDYLAPYIASIVEHAEQFKGDYTNITLKPEDARKIRDAALQDLKDRLIQRGHIMQNRMDREKEELNREQNEFQRNTESDSGKGTEKFAQICKDATWRMKILDERLSKHIEQASEKYAALAQKLATDKRLAPAYK